MFSPDGTLISASAAPHCGALLIQIQELLHKINADQREIVFMWVPGHVGIRGDEAADRTAKEALDQKLTADLMPFSDLKPLTAKYVYQVCRKNGMKLVWYLKSFMKFYRNFQTNCYLFVIQGKKTLF